MSTTTTRGRADNLPFVFPGKFADETFDYFIPVSAITDPATDAPLKVALATAPSGMNELSLHGLVYDPDRMDIRVTVSDGQPGRIYTFKYAITLTSGEVRELIASLTVGRVLATDQPAIAESQGFGRALHWPLLSVAVYGQSKYGDGSVYGGEF